MLECPAHTDCQGYVGLLANGFTEEAVRLIMEKIPAARFHRQGNVRIPVRKPAEEQLWRNPSPLQT